RPIVSAISIPHRPLRAKAGTRTSQKSGGQFWTPIPYLMGSLFHAETHSMALRWMGAAMQEAVKGFRRLKAHKQLPLLKDALAKHKAKAVPSNEHLAHNAKAA
ncbi:MAG TPA: hypothetical protein VFE63_20445, partial [Roseiarcus sp.]|nr:hypothetical protein [Roseiarcus sp.]